MIGKNNLIPWQLSLLLALMMGGNAPPVEAGKTIHVSTSGDDTTGDGSAGNPYRTIQKGIDMAAATDDTVEVAAGKYLENLVWDAKSLVLKGAGAGKTIVDGDVDEDGTGDGSCLKVTNVDDLARIEGFTFQHGYAQFGGGLYLINAPLTLTHSEIKDNRAWDQGGGLYLDSSAATLTDNDIEDNWAEDHGGGLFLYRSAPTLTDNDIVGNQAANWDGGGLYLQESPATLTDNRISDNLGQASGGGLFLNASNATLTDNWIGFNWTNVYSGGGVLLLNSAATLTGNWIGNNWADDGGGGVYFDNSAATLTGNWIGNNWAVNWGGGGLGLGNNSEATLTDNYIENNWAQEHGGGVRLDSSDATLTGNTIRYNGAEQVGGGLFLNASDATLTDNRICDNVGYKGGGLYLMGDSDVAFTRNEVGDNVAIWGGGLFLSNSDGSLASSQICSNRARAGGGLYLESGSEPTMSNNNICGNQANQGGGVYLNASDATLTNNTIADNRGEGVLASGSSPLITNSILWGNTGAGDLVDASATYSDVGTGNTAGTGNLSVNPRFWGGGDYHLKPTSPCIHKGDNAAVVLATDIDGEPRITGSRVDMGADEVRVAVVLQPDLWIKQGKNWRGNDIYNGDGTKQTGTQSVVTGATAVYWARLYNDGKKTETFWIQGPRGGGNWTVRYYNGTTADPTREVTDLVTRPQGWKRPNVPKGGKRSFLITVTPGSDAASPGDLLITARSGRDPKQRDTLRCLTTVPNLQPDLWIKQGTKWLGKNIYNEEGMDQTGTRKVKAGTKAVYQAQLHNAGEKTETFWIKGPAGDTDWEIRYYKGTAVKPSKEVTAQVTSAQGWKRANVPPGGKRDFRITVKPRSGLSSGSSREVLVWAESKRDPTQRDTIKAITRVK